MNNRNQEEQIYQLVSAANRGDLNVIKELLKNGVPADELHNNEYTTLSLAVQNGQTKILLWLK